MSTHLSARRSLNSDLITPKFLYFNTIYQSLFWSDQGGFFRDFSSISHNLQYYNGCIEVAHPWEHYFSWNIFFSNCSSTTSTTSIRTPSRTPKTSSQNRPPRQYLFHEHVYLLVHIRDTYLSYCRSSPVLHYHACVHWIRALFLSLEKIGVPADKLLHHQLYKYSQLHLIICKYHHPLDACRHLLTFHR